MASATQIRETAIPKSHLWTGRVLSGLVVLFLLVDGVMKLFKPPIVITTTAQLGVPESVITLLGALLVGSTILYLIPRTSVLGAILLTGYFGGAIMTQLRVGNPLFSHVLFPVYLGIMVWGGLYARDLGVRALIPLKS